MNGRVVRDPQAPTDVAHDRIVVDGTLVGAQEKVYLALNKPRGYLTTASDEHDRDTVYTLLRNTRDWGADARWIAPVGRLDKASEGLLLFSNDSTWAAMLTDPASHLNKTYHVQIDTVADAALLARLSVGIVDDGVRMSLKSVRELRRGEKNSWLEIILDEGRNRQIRRILASFEIGVLRLVRVAIGPIVLGDLAKGAVRRITTAELQHVARIVASARGR